MLPPGFTLLPLSKPGKEAILHHAPNADYLLVGGRVKIDRDILDAATHLKMVQRTGVGLDSLDLDSLKERNIPVCVNAGVNSRSVAEHTMLLILSVLRRLPLVDQSVKSGEWKKHELGIRCNDLYGKAVGLIGLGSIGSKVAQMLQPFGVRVLYHVRTRLDIESEQKMGITHSGFEDLLERSDIVSLHCPLTPKTEGLIDAQAFSLMKKGVILINTARGGLIDEPSLLENLRTGHVRGVGFDVFAAEPIPKDSELLTYPNAVFTPHMSGLTIETFRSMMSAALENISKFEVDE